jgi:hypothetical protein
MEAQKLQGTAQQTEGTVIPGAQLLQEGGMNGLVNATSAGKRWLGWTTLVLAG